MDNPDHSSTLSPGPPHLQHPQVGAVERRSLSVPGHVAVELLSLELPPSQGVSSEGCAGEPHALAGWRRDVMPGCGLEGALIRGPGQGLEEVVEQARAQSFVHPVAGEEHVVHLVHALDVPCAVLLLGLQA